MRKASLVFAVGLVAVAGLAACGSTKKAVPATTTTLAPHPVALRARVLYQADLPAGIKAQRTARIRQVNLLVRGLDPLFLPRVIARNLRDQGFAIAVEEPLRGVGRRKNVSGFDAALRVRTATDALSEIQFFHKRSLHFCLRVCDVTWKSFNVPGVSGGLGSERYRTTKTKNGPAFHVYYVLFANGPWAYALTLGGPPGAVSRNEVIRAADALYARVNG